MDPELQSPLAPSFPGTPFGEQNRRRLIRAYLEAHGQPDAASAWKKVYGMLLWVDRTTGLAHCYESDKCQPGRLWYTRSLAFHDWLAREFGENPMDVGRKLDWLFQQALEPFLKLRSNDQQAMKARGADQRALFAKKFPMPGTDPEIERIVGEALKPFLSKSPPLEVFDAIADSLREYWKQENKRKNLLGEGFEDVLAAVIEAACPNGVNARTRTSIADIGGFHALGAKDKATKVDLVIEHLNWPRPALINVKWSIRADREDQLWDDFHEYVRFDRDHRGFDHYLVTNEFDPARLNAVCGRREANNYIFNKVVHINPDGVLAAYNAPLLTPQRPALTSRNDSRSQVSENVKTGRMVSLEKWLTELSETTGAAPSS